MDDLIARIRAAIDEDERVALAANPSPWRWRIEGADHLDQNTVFGDGSPRGFDKLRHVCSVDYAWEREANAAHIIRHDPARVLRQVAAHRKILAEHSDPHGRAQIRAVVPDYPDRDHCGDCGTNPCQREEWCDRCGWQLCPTVLALADVYRIDVT